MKLEVSGCPENGKFPGKYCMGVPAEGGPAQFGENVSPRVGWSQAPEGTKSFALLLVDIDVPSVGDDVNQPERTVPEDLPRVDFYHWVLVDIPADRREIPEGASASGVTEKGKALGQTGYGVTGINDYTGWFGGDPDMGGNYGGYDGPFPPWNDERIHRYYFRLYALDVETLGLAGAFSGSDAVAAMEGHVLDQAEYMAKYSLYKEVN